MASYNNLVPKKEMEQCGICVVAKPNEPIEVLLKRFKKKYMKSGLAQELRRRMFYEKPSDARRRKRIEAARRRKKDQEKLEKSEQL